MQEKMLSRLVVTICLALAACSEDGVPEQDKEYLSEFVVAVGTEAVPGGEEKSYYDLSFGDLVVRQWAQTSERWRRSTERREMPDTLFIDETDALLPNFGSPEGRFFRLLLCSQTLDRRKVDFSGFIAMAGWKRHCDSAARLGLSGRSRHAAELHCSTYANPPFFPVHLQGS